MTRTSPCRKTRLLEHAGQEYGVSRTAPPAATRLPSGSTPNGTRSSRLSAIGTEARSITMAVKPASDRKRPALQSAKNVAHAGRPAGSESCSHHDQAPEVSPAPADRSGGVGTRLSDDAGPVRLGPGPGPTAGSCPVGSTTASGGSGSSTPSGSIDSAPALRPRRPSPSRVMIRPDPRRPGWTSLGRFADDQVS